MNLSSPFALLLSLIVFAAAHGNAIAEDATPTRALTAETTLATARAVLQEVIQEEGLLAGQIAHVGDMLARTGPSLGKTRNVFAEAEVVQFCSARDAWQMTEENPDQIAYCPLAISLYTLADSPGTVHIVYRFPGTDSQARAHVAALLNRIAATVQQRLKHP